MKIELERMWKVKVKLIPVVVGILGAGTPKLARRVVPTNLRNIIRALCP